MSMTPKSSNVLPNAVRGQRAFSLVEILMTVAMLSVIILGLVAMFDQTRRAFTSSMTQVDVLEGGRAATAFIANDLEQLAPCYASNALAPLANFENFYMDVPSSYYAVVQTLTDPGESRTNMLQELYFITRYNQQWTAVGYKIDLNGETNGVGTLYRWSSNNIPVTSTNLSNLVLPFTSLDPSTNGSRIIDGVIDFRIRAYDMNGNLLGTNVAIPWFGKYNNIYTQTNATTGEPMYYRFRSNAVPAYVEVELGILETRTLQRYYSMTNNPSVAEAFLTNHAAQVHMFRQRVPIRAVDPTAYPFTPPTLP